MKKCVWIFSTLLLGAVGCNKIKQLANIDKDIPFTQTVNVPKFSSAPVGSDIPGGVSVQFPTVAIATNASEDLSQYHASAKKVVSVSLRSLYLKMLPKGRNFDAMDSLVVYISTKSLPQELMAYNYSIPKGTDSLSMNVSNTNFKDYFLQDTIYLQLRGHFTAVPPTGSVIKAGMTFHLVANPLD